jgi:hypothetical protein
LAISHCYFPPQITKSTKVVHLIRRLIDIGIYTPKAKAAAAAAASALRQQQPHGLVVAGSSHHIGGILKHSANSTGSSSSSLVKAIVFSQFWMHLQLIGSELLARGVRHYLLKRDMTARDKQAAVTAFRASPSNCCLVMDESGGGRGSTSGLLTQVYCNADSICHCHPRVNLTRGGVWGGRGHRGL